MSQWPLGQGRLQVDGGLCGSTSHIIDDGGCFWNRDGPGEGGKAIMSTTCRVRVTGPLAVYAEGFRADLAAQGYVAESADRNLRTLAHVSRWMDGQGISAGQLSAARLEEFVEARRREGYHHALSIRAVMPLISYLRRLGVGELTAEARPTAARWMCWSGSTVATWSASGS